MRDPTKGLETAITEAQRKGKFDDLPGKGKPLVIDTSPDAVIKGLLKEANVSFAPEWIHLANEIDRLLEEEQQLLQRYAATYESDVALLAAAAVSPDDAGEPSEPPARGGRWRQVVARWASGRSTRVPAAGTRRARSLADVQRAWDRALERYAALLHDLNRKIRRFNQLVPLTNRQRVPPSVKERLEAFIGRFPRLSLADDGTVRPVPSLVPAPLLVPPAETEDPMARKRSVLEAVALQRARRREPPPIG
jgi:hypothetical protein